jgi:succinyl-diaminopimelate desuccinylase
MLRKLRARLGLTLLLIIGAPIMDNTSLPFVFDHIELQGRRVGHADAVGNARRTGAAHQIKAAGRGPRRGGMPLRDGPADATALLEQMLQERFIAETAHLVTVPTYRTEAPESEQQVVANLTRARDYLLGLAEAFNQGQKTLQLKPFEWRRPGPTQTQWVFGFRLGSGPRRVAILTHLDTVPPGNADWRPFEPRIEERAYNGTVQPFLVGRGAADDKGPAILGFIIMRALAKLYDGTDAFDGLTVEQIFDTSEETDFSTTYYFQEVGAPDFGIVFDAVVWTVRAEKGIERPLFTVPLGEPARSDIFIEAFNSAAGAVNQIPDTATARIVGGDNAALDTFAADVANLYNQYGFDDPHYRRAPLTVSRDGQAVVLTTEVIGAQHGSVPDQNRADGANPVISLSNFLAHLVDNQTLALNGVGRMMQFMAWGWGTTVFGEKQPDLLEAHDQIFEQGNGTTYALTQVQTNPPNVTLAMDIRYALGHHSVAWDGKTEGQLPDPSLFSEVFDALVTRFQQERPGTAITVTTVNVDAPDVRDPQSAIFQQIGAAYQRVVGAPMAAVAIGASTDAKGHVELVAAGSLFSLGFGPPVNFHGLNEGAPIEDLRLSARILYQIMLDEIADNTTR